MRETAMTTPDIRIDEAGRTEPTPLLEIRDLAITFKTDSGEVQAVRNAHLTIMPGETVAIVGESGSGKSTIQVSPPPPSPLSASCRPTAECQRGKSCSTARTLPMRPSHG
jgi:hypothetical protein